MSLQINIEINDIDEKVLKNDLMNIENWVRDAVAGKIHSCFGNMRQQWVQQLMDDPSFTQSIPADKDAFVAMITSLPQYKDRAQREAESQLPAA